MAKITVNLDDDLETAPSEALKLKEMAAPLPSTQRAKQTAIKDAPRVQFAFSNVPKPIKEAFITEAKKRKITQKELLYICLRAGGLDIPDSDEIDGRRR